MTYTIQDCTPGTSWAARFRVTTWLDHQGAPVSSPKDLALGDTTDTSIGEYTGLGIINTRDLAKDLVQLVDTATQQEFVVAVDDLWDIDRVEWRDAEEA
jgi:hypothetical protein